MADLLYKKLVSTIFITNCIFIVSITMKAQRVALIIGRSSGTGFETSLLLARSNDMSSNHFGIVIVKNSINSNKKQNKLNHNRKSYSFSIWRSLLVSVVITLTIEPKPSSPQPIETPKQIIEIFSDVSIPRLDQIYIFSGNILDSVNTVLTNQ